MKVEVDLTEYGVKAPKWYDPINPHVINASGGSGGSNDVELTWEEYEALSEEEKMNGSNYFITDIGNPKSLVRKELLKEESHTGNYTYTLNESIKNFDYIIAEATNANGGYRRTSTFLNVSEYYNDAFGCLLSYKQNDNSYASINLNFNTDGTQAITVLNYYNQSFNPSSVIIRITGYRYERVVVPNQMVNYSTVEQRIGTWIDGKPLYQKTVNCGALPNATIKNVPHGIDNFGKLVSIYGVARHPDYQIYIPYREQKNNVIADIYHEYIEIISATNMSSYTESELTLQYTKTTD